MDTFEEFEKRVLDFGAIQYDGLADDDDPLGHAMIDAPEGMTMMAIDTAMLAPGSLKQTILGVCAAIVKEKATRIGWLLASYKIVPVPGDDRPPAANFADDDRAVEVMRCYVLDAERVSAYEAPIQRSPSKVGDWEEVKGTRSPFISLPQRALAMAAESAS